MPSASCKQEKAKPFPDQSVSSMFAKHVCIENAVLSTYAFKEASQQRLMSFVPVWDLLFLGIRRIYGETRK